MGDEATQCACYEATHMSLTHVELGIDVFPKPYGLNKCLGAELIQEHNQQVLIAAT